jgi:hypothetical protein
MVNIDALLRAMPVSSLEPDWVACLGGFSEPGKERDAPESIYLLEPPAGQREPYIEPLGALERLLRHQGVAKDAALTNAGEAVSRMKQDIAQDHWINFFDDLEPDSPECLPVPDFVAWLRKENLVPSGIMDFFDQAAEVTRRTPMFRGPDNWNEPWALENLPTLPPPKAMIEFVPGPSWADQDDGNWVDDPACYYPLYSPFHRWREAMRPVARMLETALGVPVYYFANLASDTDDDDVHRFLVIHWCCTHKPESAYVRYLVKVSGARDVEELKAALIDPASYAHPFTMNHAETIEARCCRIDYLPPEAHQTIGVVFLTAQAREVAQSLLTQHIGAHALIVAPMELATNEWVAQATRHARSTTVNYVHDSKLDDLLGILASVDILCVIANEKTPGRGFDLKLTEGAADLLWLALTLGVKTHYYNVDRSELLNPDTSLQRHGSPGRTAARQAQRAAFTRQLKVIRLDNEFGSSGLWDEQGKMLSYDQLDLPFALVRRIAAWQREFNTTLNLPDNGDDLWWERHEQEAIAIAQALRAALGSEIAVKLYRPEGWMNVDQIVSGEAA